MTPVQIHAIERPRSESDFAACYFANLSEARAELERALVRFRGLCRAGNITERADDKGGFIFADKHAAQSYGDVVRFRGDVDHWHARLVQARANERGEAVRAMGREFEPGADDAPVEPDRRLPPEKDDEADDGFLPF